MQKFHGQKVLKLCRVCSLITAELLESNIKRYLKITHIFSNAMWHLTREIFNLATESLNKVRLKKTQRVTAEKKAFKWEIGIKIRNQY